MTMKDSILNSLKELDLDCKICEHEPVLDFETAALVDERFHLTGVESKSLFIKTKSEKYYIYLTVQGEKLDSKYMKKLLGEKVSVVGPDELTNLTTCVPGCVAPFGFDKELNVRIIVDKKIFNYEKFIFSPAVPEMTVEAKTEDLPKMLEQYYDEILYKELDEEE